MSDLLDRTKEGKYYIYEDEELRWPEGFDTFNQAERYLENLAKVNGVSPSVLDRYDIRYEERE